MSDTQAQFIDVDELCVGMYIYLDLGWIGHPFALNNFKIVSDSQIETIRGLGLKRLRWSPERSDLTTPDTASSAAETAGEERSPAAERRQILLAQHASLARCEREFSDATRSFRDILKLVQTHPEPARERAEVMVDDLVGTLLDQGECFIRLLSEKAGEKSSLHAINVTVIALLLGKSLGLDAAALKLLGLGALLHDIGKIELPERLRWRDDGFNAAERKLFQQHVDCGVELAARMGIEAEACRIIAQHHEYVDGSGFPRQLRGEALTQASRILELVNHYDNLCNPANPVAAITPHKSLSLMFAQSRQKFDADILGVFIRMMGVYPPGSMVTLTDNRYALVVSVNSSRPLKPRVLIHDSRIPRDDALVVDLEEESELGIRLSLKPEQLPRAVFDYLSPGQRMCYFFERARAQSAGSPEEPMSRLPQRSSDVSDAGNTANGIGLWQALIEGLIEAVWLVDPFELRIVAVNGVAEELLGITRASLVGRPVIELACTPEDVFFWEDVAAGKTDHLLSETMLRRHDNTLVTVLRRVSRVQYPNGPSFYVVGISNQSERRAVESELEKLVAELRATLESTADGILVTALDGAIRGFNQGFAEMWNLPEALLTERDDAGVYGWMARSVLDPGEYAARIGAIGHDPLLEALDVLVLRNGKVLERATLPQYARGHPIGRVYSFRDITQRLADEKRLTLANRVFEASLDAIFVTDPEFRIMAVNPACERMTDCLSAELAGQTLTQSLHLWLGDHPHRAIVEALASDGFWQGEIMQRTKAGLTFPCLVSLVRVLDAEGAPFHYVGFVKDLSEAAAARQRIEQLAYTDALTGLPNRIRFAERLEFAITLAQRERTSFAVLFIDIDRFKQINDSLGHIFGDRVLVEVAQRITQCLRQVDTTARLGGDEFVLLLHQANGYGAEQTARRLLDAMAQPFAIDEMKFSLTCSIGIALYPVDGVTLDDLIKNADSAMYHVKDHGRGDFRFYQRQMNVDLLNRMKLDHAMREALVQQDFRLAYQPQIDLRTDRVIGVEALLRWHDRELGEISPGQFIPIAEETGFIVALGDWVLREAIRQGEQWHLQGIELTMSVNVSAVQFQQTNFVESLAQLLANSRLPPGRLELELTESILIQHVDDTLVRLDALVALGVRLAIDDFGTGYSNLAYLNRFPLHRLKIDRSFVRDLPDDDSDAAIATAVINLARALKLRVIAEGVENDHQRDFLLTAGCDEFQGFLCAPALEPADFLTLAERIGLADAPTSPTVPNLETEH